MGINRRSIICLLILSLSSVSVFAFVNRDLLPQVQDKNGVIYDYVIPPTIEESDFQKASEESSGWTATSRGGILSAIGYFNYGDTVVVYDKGGEYRGKYIVYATSRTDNEDDTVYKLLKPIHKRLSSPAYVPSGLKVEKKFNMSITPYYDYLFSSYYGSVHVASLSFSFPKYAYPVSLTFGPVFHTVPGRSLSVLGGSLGALYMLPLDFMANTVTNIHFVFSFNLNLGAKLMDNKDAFCYGYSFAAGLRWYALSFLAVNLSFSLSSMYDSSSSSLFSGYGVRMGVTFET